MSEYDLKINVGAREEEVAELGVSLDVLPLAGAVLFDAGSQRFFFFGSPLLLRISHL